MNRRKDDALIAQFAECADMLLSGASVAACLERFPEHAAQLEPLLVSAAGARQARGTPVRSTVAAERSRVTFMAETVRVQRSRAAGAAAGADTLSWWQRIFTIFQPPTYGAPRTRPVALFAILLILFISGIVISGSVTLAANALPGDPLYGVKTATEDVRLFLAPGEGTRSQLRREFGQRRIDEAQTIVERRRPVDNLRLQGTIESFDAQQWLVSGLRIALDAASQVEGVPAVGAQVEGRVRAPGDGRLLLIFAEVEPLPATSQVRELTIPARSAESAPSPTATSTLGPSATPPPTSAGSSALPGQTPREPTDAPTALPSATPTVTRMPTATPTRTLTPTRTPTPLPTATWTLPAPRPTQASSMIIGVITAINGNVWTIGGTRVEVTSSTVISGNAVVGANATCEAWERPGQLPLAHHITVTAPVVTPEPFEFQGYIEAIARPWWTIDGFKVKETEGASISPGLAVGNRVSVKALRQANGELWATSITLAETTIVQIEGTIEAVSASSIKIDGVTMSITADTKFVGTPAVGRQAQAQALQLSDGSLIAQVVVVMEPPTNTPTPEPTYTLTPEPTATPTPEPTDTPEPTATPSPEPTATPTAEPTAAPTVEPTATPEGSPTPQ